MNPHTHNPYPPLPRMIGDTRIDGQQVLVYLMAHDNTFGLFTLEQLQMAHYATQIAIQFRGLDVLVANTLETMRGELTTHITRWTLEQLAQAPLASKAIVNEEGEKGLQVPNPISPKPFPMAPVRIPQVDIQF